MADKKKSKNVQKNRAKDDGTVIWLDKDLRRVFTRISMKIVTERQDPFINPSDIIRILIERYEGKSFQELLDET